MRRRVVVASLRLGMGWMMQRWIKGKSLEERMEMMSQMMPEMFADMRPREMMQLMSSVMPKMMERCVTAMKPEEMISTMHELVPKMMESCFSQMNVEQRKGMLVICRGILNDLEKRHT